MATGGATWRCSWEVGAAGTSFGNLGKSGRGMDYLAVNLAVQRFGHRMEKDARLRATLTRCEEKLNKCKNV